MAYVQGLEASSQSRMAHFNHGPRDRILKVGSGARRGSLTIYDLSRMSPACTAIPGNIGLPPRLSLLAASTD